MKQLTIISGKGGTGKTSITAAFASLAKNTVLADCDVEAPDLHLILKPKVKESFIFQGTRIASIDKERCITCNKCYEACRFEAIDDQIDLIKWACEGCGVCKYVCPENAITMINRDSGCTFISETRFGPMSHASLNIGEEASGKLILLVRENALKLAKERQKNLIIIDGPPGIGCPVISSITGVNLVLIVTEPTLSAIHDLERVFEVTNHFGIPAVVCINKYSINEKNTKKIEQYCKSNNISVVGKIPYDPIFTEAIINGKTLIEFSNGILSKKVRDVLDNVMKNLG